MLYSPEFQEFVGKNEKLRTFLIFCTCFLQNFEKVENFGEKIENYELKFSKKEAYDDAGRGT